MATHRGFIQCLLYSISTTWKYCSIAFTCNELTIIMALHSHTRSKRSLSKAELFCRYCREWSLCLTSWTWKMRKETNFWGWMTVRCRLENVTSVFTWTASSSVLLYSSEELCQCRCVCLSVCCLTVFLSFFYCLLSDCVSEFFDWVSGCVCLMIWLCNSLFVCLLSVCLSVCLLCSSDINL